MRRLLTLVALFVAAAQPSAAAVLNFVLQTSGGNGHVAEQMEEYDIGFSLYGNSDQTGQLTWTTYSTMIGDTGGKPLAISGDWSYITFDKRGASADTFGYILNGVRTELFDKSGSKSQAGMLSLLLSTGDVFGWYVDSVDGLGGRAMIGVAANVAPVPLPAAGLLLVGGMAALGAAARRRKAAA